MTRGLLRQADNLSDIESQNETGGIEDDDDDGWADPESQSPPKSFASQSQFPEAPEDLGPHDPHPYAYKKRATRRSSSQRQSKNRWNRRTDPRHKRSNSHRVSTRDHDNDGSDSGIERTQPRRRMVSKTSGQKRSSNVTRRLHRRSNALTNDVYDTEERNLQASFRSDSEWSSREGSSCVPTHGMTEFLDSSSGPSPWRQTARSRAAADREQITSRKQRFLDTDAENVTSLSSSNSGQERPKKRSRRGRQNPTVVDTCPSTLTDNYDQRQSLKDLQQVLFSSLLPRSSIENNDLIQLEPCESSAEVLFQQLKDCYPGPGCQRLLHNIVSNYESNHLDADRSTCTIFSTFYSLLSTGPQTLQMLLSTKRESLSSHICMLASILRLLPPGAKYLTENDGIIFQLFSPINFKHFIDSLFVQAVDSLYSLFLPEAWALSITDPAPYLRELKPLFSALQQHLHLTERLCKCLAEKLECQRWFVATDEAKPFVSCVDPDLWSEFVLFGKRSPEPMPQNIRLRSFRKSLPRCEIDAVWCILAYLSSIQQKLDDPPIYSWKMVTRLLYGGVLAREDSTLSLPPCEAQLSCAAYEIRLLSQLVKADSFGQLPQDDKRVTDLIARMLQLEADGVEFDVKRNVFQYNKRMKKDARDFWASAANTTVESLLQPPSGPRTISDEAASDGQGNVFFGQPLMLPSSAITRACMCLLAAWISKVPPQKKPRQKRLTKELSEFLTTITTATLCFVFTTRRQSRYRGPNGGGGFGVNIECALAWVDEADCFEELYWIDPTQNIQLQESRVQFCSEAVISRGVDSCQV